MAHCGSDAWQGWTPEEEESRKVRTPLFASTFLTLPASINPSPEMRIHWVYLNNYVYCDGSLHVST